MQPGQLDASQPEPQWFNAMMRRARADSEGQRNDCRRIAEQEFGGRGTEAQVAARAAELVEQQQEQLRRDPEFLRAVAEVEAELREQRRQQAQAQVGDAFRARADELGAMAPPGARAESRTRERRDNASRSSSGGGDSGDSDPGEPEPGPGPGGADVQHDQRVALFDMLADGEHWIELRSRHPRGYWPKDFAATPEQADRLAHRRILEGCDVHVGALPRLGRHGDAQRRYAPACVLWADCDSTRSVRKLELFEPAPTAIVESGGVDDDGTPKLHAYWR